MTPEKKALLVQGKEVCILSPNAGRWRMGQKAIVFVPQCGKTPSSFSYRSENTCGFKEDGKGYVGVLVERFVYVGSNLPRVEWVPEVVRVQDVRCEWAEYTEQQERSRKAAEEANKRRTETHKLNNARMTAINAALRERGLISGPDYNNLNNFGESNIKVSLDMLEKLLGIEVANA